MRVATRTYLSALVLASMVSSVSAQNVRLNFFSGYTYQDRFPIGGTYYGYTYSEGRIADGQHYGGSIEFEVRSNHSVELLYQQQNAEGYLGTGLTEFGPYDVRIHYMMIGGLSTIPFSDAVGGYGGLNIGAGWMTGDNEATKFAWGLKGGLQFNLSDVVGIRAGAQLLSPVQSFGGGFYFGTGGAGAGVSTYSSIYQFAWTGGLTFTLPRGGSSAPSHGQRRGSAPPPPPPPPAR
jgi:hypothetical protein